MEILNFSTLQAGQSVSDVLVYVQSYKKRTYANGQKSFISGTLSYKGVVLAFNIWDAKLVEIFATNNIEGAIIQVSGDIKTYEGALQLTVTSVHFNHGFTDISQFIKSVNIEDTFKEFVDFVNSGVLSQNALRVLLDIFKKENLFDDFKNSFAGSKMHDAQVGGLMNHTLKMLKITKTIIGNDKRLVPYADILYLGVIFHDIGKVYELDLDKYTTNSFVTHRTLGAEIIIKHKEDIINNLGERFYYHLLAILQGHHGEYGDKPTTVWAYVVHLIDMLDSMVTGMLDRVESNDVSKVANGNISVFMRDSYLVL